MREKASKKNQPRHPQTQKPFFQYEGKTGFFAKESEQEPAFFTKMLMPDKTMAPPPEDIQLTPAIDTPGRSKAVHQNLFISAPGLNNQPQTPWGTNTGAEIIQRFKASVQNQINNHPTKIIGQVSQRTTEADAERDALQINTRITQRFSQIATQLTETQVRTAVEIMPANQVPSQNFMEQWLANKLISNTNIATFQGNMNDPHHQQLIQSLLADTAAFDLNPMFESLRRQLRGRAWTEHEINTTIRRERQSLGNPTWSRILQILASRQAAFAEQGQRVVLNRGLTQSRRQFTLIHEFVHFYAHADYTSWVQATTSPRLYNEGFTEFLTREVMTANERTQRLSQPNNYQDRVQEIEQKVLPFASVEDIALAYFKGEVWRLEHQSKESQQAFGRQLGLQAGASRSDEVSQSQSSPGIVQTVETNRRFRFMNLAIEGADPKAEHRTFFQTIFNQTIRPNPDVRIRFVGHTSSTGSQQYNRALSARRVRAFYQMARDVGVPANQLLNQAHPESEGETTPTADNDSVIGRAMNRRVELYIILPDLPD